MRWPTTPITDPAAVRLPIGSRLDAAAILAVATHTNAAHAAIGTQLFDVGASSVTLGVMWRPDLAGADGAWAPEVCALLIDHAGSLGALVALGDAARFGGTLGIHVVHHAPASAGWGLLAQGVATVDERGTVQVAVTVWAVDAAGADGGAPGSSVVCATGTCTVAVRG